MKASLPWHDERKPAISVLNEKKGKEKELDFKTSKAHFFADFKSKRTKFPFKKFVELLKEFSTGQIQAHNVHRNNPVDSAATIVLHGFAESLWYDVYNNLEEYAENYFRYLAEGELKNKEKKNVSKRKSSPKPSKRGSGKS